MRTLILQDSGASSELNVESFGNGSPRITFTAGIHGDEVSGIYIAEKLLEYFYAYPPKKGTVTFLTRCNPTATRCLQRRSPFDREDLNRIFPGNGKGSLSYRIADAVWKETANAEYLIDLHCCGQHGLPYLLGIYDESAPTRALAERIALPIAIQSAGTGGQLFTESCRTRGQAALIIEIPSGPSAGAINLAVAEQVLAGLLSFLTDLSVAAGEKIACTPVFYGPLTDITAAQAGLWIPSVQRGEAFQAGQTLGEVDDVPVLAPEDGFAMSVLPAGYLFRDDLWVVTYAVSVS